MSTLAPRRRVPFAPASARLLGHGLVLVGMLLEVFAYLLWQFVASGHGPGPLRNEVSRLAEALSERPALLEDVRAVAVGVGRAFAWLDAALLALFVAAFALLAAGIVLSRGEAAAGVE